MFTFSKIPNTTLGIDAETSLRFVNFHSNFSAQEFLNLQFKLDKHERLLHATYLPKTNDVEDETNLISSYHATMV